MKAQEVLDIFFEEMERRDWSTSISDVNSAYQATTRAARQADKPELGKMPNSRAGFYHIHSASYECGLAYWDDDLYRPCSKLVNHPGLCGYEDNSAF